LWVDGPAVPPPDGGAGLELVLVAVLDGGVLLLAAVLLARVLLAAVLDGALVVGRAVVLVGVGLLVGAVEVGRIGGRWWSPCHQMPVLAWVPPVRECAVVLAATAWLPSSSSAITPTTRATVRVGVFSRTGLPCRALPRPDRTARCLTEDMGAASLHIGGTRTVRDEPVGRSLYSSPQSNRTLATPKEKSPVDQVVT
jgi:hypothetical protein